MTLIELWNLRRTVLILMNIFIGHLLISIFIVDAYGLPSFYVSYFNFLQAISFRLCIIVLY